MKNLATFTLLDRIVRISPLNNVTKVTIAANYRRKVKDAEGGYEDDPHFNEVTVFDPKTRSYIERHVQKGDLVHVDGRLRQNSFERDGRTVYTTDLIALDFGKLASKRESGDDLGDG